MPMDPQTFARIKPLLDSPRSQGERIWAYCPTHPDGTKGRRGGQGLAGRSLSLSIKYGLICHAGCSERPDWFKDVLTLMGYYDENRRDTKPSNSREPVPATSKPPQQKRGRRPEHAELVAVYDYTDPETGRVLAHKGRWQWAVLESEKGYDKDFGWWLPGNRPESGLQGGKVDELPLWGAELVLAAPKEQIVWFVEGEETCKALRARNELVVCSSQGASGRNFGDALDILEDRTVRIWPDKDERGFEFASHLALLLQPLAKNVEIVIPPAWLPAKGDAVDFFTGQGKLDELQLKTVTGLTVVPVADDHIQVQVLTESGAFANFEFEEMAYTSGRSLDASLTVQIRGKGMERTPYKQRVNLRSGTARRDLETALNKQFRAAGVNWTLIISKAWDAAESTFRARRQPVQVTEVDDEEAEMFLIPDILTEGEPTIIFGDGSAGKSYLAARMGAAVAWGWDFAGREAVQRNVLYVDWETTERTWKRRMRRIYEGMGLDRDATTAIPMYYWNSVGLPLVESVDQIKSMVRKLEIGLVIIDSGGFACGGPPEESKPSIDFWNSLGRIPATKLILAHVSKAAMEAATPPDRPFGSQYWHNGARRTWYVARSSEVNADDIEIGMYCKKVNDGPLPRGIGFNVHFEGKRGPVSFEAKPIEDTTFADAHRSPKERVMDYLSGALFTKTKTSDIAEAVGMKTADIYALMKRHPQTFVAVGNAGGGGQAWGLLARDYGAAG